MQIDGSKMFNIIIALIVELLELINKAAYEVRINLASGYLESVYKNALMCELERLGLHAEKEVALPVYYKGIMVGEFRADIVVNDIIIEVKACRELSSAHEAQLVNYLVATGYDKGVLIDYGGEKFAFRIKDRNYHKCKRF